MTLQLRDDGMPSHSRLAYARPKPVAVHGQRPTGYCRGLTSEAGQISSPTQPLPTQVDARTDFTAPQEAGNDPDNDMDRTVASMDKKTCHRISSLDLGELPHPGIFELRSVGCWQRVQW